MSDINKTSIAYTVTDFIDRLEKHVLSPEEEINEAPSSFISLMSSTLGKTSAYSYFQMLMAKRELNPSTAVMAKSLMRSLKSDQINDIYGTPSHINIVMSFPEEDIIDAAIPIGNNQYKLTLNKGTTFTISSSNPIFTLDYNIDIIITKYKSNGENKCSIYAVYDINDIDSGNIITCNNPYISSRNDIVVDNKKHFTMYLNIRQFTRNENIFEMSGESKNINIDYSDSLMGFVVLYKNTSDEDYHIVNTYLEGDNQTDGVNYSLNDQNGTKSIRLKFSKLPNSFNPTNGIMKVIVYTTKGKDGNFNLGQVDEDTMTDFGLMYAQDTSDAYQEALINLIPTVTVIGTEATGGKNSKTIEEIRTLAINAGQGEVITPYTLKTAALKKGFSSNKTRHDLLAFEYLLSTYLKSGINTIPTKMIDGRFALSDIQLDSESNSRMITPSDVFKYGNSGKYEYIPFKKINDYNTFYNEYQLNPSAEYCFPYYIRIENGSTPNIKVYDESCNDNKSTNFLFLNDTLLDKASILSANIYRNPFSENNDKYKISFAVESSEYLVDHLKNLSETDNPYIKFRVILKNTNDNSKYACDVKLSDCTFEDTTIYCNVWLSTSSAVLNSGKININNNSIKSIPFTNTQYQFYYIDGNVDIDIAIIFKELDDDLPLAASQYDYYLDDSEINNRYYIGVIYSISDVNLAKDVTSHINLTPDMLLSQATYKTADKDIPDTYEENVYKMDGDNYVMEEQNIVMPDGTVQKTNGYVLLHKAGDTKQALNGCVGSYNTISTNNDWKWSLDGIDSNSEVSNDGTVLGGSNIYSVIQWNNLVIFGGADGRIGCYDINTKKWHNYNTTNAYRGNDSESGYVITNTGTCTGYKDIRGMRILKYNNENILFVYGEGGVVASCNLAYNSWKNFDGSGGDSIASYYNNGGAMGAETIYCSETYTNTSNEPIIVFGGGSGRICSLNIKNNAWYGYDRNETDISRDKLFSDGSVRNYKSILSMSKYLEAAIYFTGINGITTVADLTTGNFNIVNDGSVVDNANMYTCIVNGNTFIIAGKNGYVASYNIVKGSWNNYNNGSGLCSSGDYIGGENINAILIYGVNIIFAGGLGRICSYETTNATWEKYDSGIGLSNDGSFINNTISCISYDNNEGDNLIYFGGSVGNITYKYKAGDLIVDSEGNPIVEKDSEKICNIYGIPAYSRLFGIENTYNAIIKAYDNAIKEIESMSTIFASGCTLHMGVKTTSGKSSTFYFINPNTQEKMYLNDLSISLKLGVKFNNNITDENAPYLIESIKEKIIEYINDTQDESVITNVEININDMLDYIKTEVPNIEYFEYYGLNNYESNECQTIYHETDVDDNSNETICIRPTINNTEMISIESDIEFTPDISINIL